MQNSSGVSVLPERAGLQSDDLALRHIDYEQDWAAISTSHGLTVADLVLVSPGSIPTTTSGKIRRAVCVEQHRRQQFTRLDA